MFSLCCLEKNIKQKLLLLSVIVVVFFTRMSAQHFDIPDMTGMQWYRGSLHTHARESESDSSVEYVVKWYREHDYDFLVITDHSTVTIPPASVIKDDSSFLFIPGEEVMGYGNGRLLEINAFNVTEDILPINSQTDLDALQKCIDAVRKKGGVPMINHPNYQWRLSGSLLLDTRDCNLFELYNGCPGTNNYGDDNHPSTEQIWDFVLSAGKRIYGTATDDAHVYRKFSADLSNPGRGWVVVKAKNLEANEILQNLEAGLFYSSAGVEITDLIVKPAQIEIFIQASGKNQYTTDFIGSEGKLLLRTKNNPAVYNLSSDEKYVRAKIVASDGSCAWVQPIFVVP